MGGSLIRTSCWWLLVPSLLPFGCCINTALSEAKTAKLILHIPRVSSLFVLFLKKVNTPTPSG